MAEQLVSDADHVSLSRLVVELSWRIDHGQADRVWELFVADGVLDTSGTPLVGHDAIREWGRGRVASTVRTRHICSAVSQINLFDEGLVYLEYLICSLIHQCNRAY